MPEGQAYTPDLTDFFAGVSAVASFQINWGDGTAGSPDVETDPAGSTPSHQYAAGVSAATLLVSSVVCTT